MRKCAYVFILLVFLSPCIAGDTAVLQAYLQSFSRSGITAKADLLGSAATDSRLNDSIDQLYDYALLYFLNNYSSYDDLSEMNNVIGITLKGLRDKGSGRSLETLWQLFFDYPVPEAKAEILVTMGILGKGNQNIIRSVNNYLNELSFLFMSGYNVDYSLVSAGITALMELGDSSSYPVLFNVLRAGFPEVIASEASGALDLIDGNLKEFLFNIIEKNPPEEKFLAFRAGINSERLKINERGELSELALDLSLSSFEEDAGLSAMRYSAVWALTSLSWTRASPLAIRHYYRVLADYLKGSVSKARLIEAIACLGAVGNSDAALALGLQLALINSGANSASVFDTDVTLAIIQALGLIGANSVFEHLIYAGNFSSNENIRAAAKEAMDRLKW